MRLVVEQGGGGALSEGVGCGGGVCLVGVG